MNGPYPPMPPPHNGMHQAGAGGAGPGGGGGLVPNHHFPRPPMIPSYSTSSTLPHRGAPNYPLFNSQAAYGGGGGNGPSGNNNPADTRTQLFVSNLPFRVRWQDLKDLMRKCGTVLRADVALNPADGRSRGFGVVLFAKAEDAAKAIATYHGYTWQTRVLDVRIDAQDPTGALALAEANRQQAMQQHQKQVEHVQQQQRAVAAAAMARQSPSSMPPPPPPPPPPPLSQPGGPFSAYGGPLAFPSTSSTSPLLQGQNGHAAGSSPRMRAQPSPVLSARNQPSHAHSGGGGDDASAPTSTLLARSSSQESRNRASPLDLSMTPTTSSGQGILAGQQPSYHPGGPERYASDSILPPRLQPSPYEQARIPPPPPPPPPHPANELPPQLQQVIAMQQQQQQPVYMPMLSVHPMGYAVPGGMLSYYSSLAAATNGIPRPGSAPPLGPNGYVNLVGGGAGMGISGPGLGGGHGPAGGLQYQNRHLFIGNLPFNCQWQELKDLMRGAGNVLRADIAQGPDGRSRGFGSVLFATPQDAERAVALFNGYEFNGRMLKVHFDKFAGAGVNNQSPSQGPPPPPVYAAANGQTSHPSMSMPIPLPHRPAVLEHFSSFGSNGSTGGNMSGPSPLSNVLHARPQSRQDELSRPGTASGDSMEKLRGDAGEQRESREVTPSRAAGGSRDGAQTNGAEERSHPTPRRRPPFLQDLGGTSSFSRTHHHSAAPSRIAMPPPLPFAALGLNGTPTSGGPGPFSPLASGGMTPSMPAFTFGGAGPFAAQATPPLVPHGMFSPGVGIAPFSPGAPYFPGTPPLVWSSLTPGGAVTPGHGFEAFNPMFPPTYGYEPVAYPSGQEPTAEQESGDVSGHAPSMAEAPAAGPEEASYFPRVEEDGVTVPMSDPVGARPATTPGGGAPERQLPAPRSTHGPSVAASAPPLSPRITARPGVGGHSKSDDAARPRQNPLMSNGDHDPVERLGDALDAVRLPVDEDSPAEAGGTDFASDGGGLGWAEGAVSPAALPERDASQAPTADGRGARDKRTDRRTRRASHDGSARETSAKPAAFGTSIWG